MYQSPHIISQSLLRHHQPGGTRHQALGFGIFTFFFFFQMNVLSKVWRMLNTIFYLIYTHPPRDNTNQLKSFQTYLEDSEEPIVTCLFHDENKASNAITYKSALSVGLDIDLSGPVSNILPRSFFLRKTLAPLSKPK